MREFSLDTISANLYDEFTEATITKNKPTNTVQSNKASKSFLKIKTISKWNNLGLVMLPYLLTFCRIVIGLVFAYAFLTKIRDVNAFNQTITRFKLLPAPWSRPMALLFLTGELAVVMLTFVGGQLLPLAFGLAFLQLAIFTMARAPVLARRIQTSCNCFGSQREARYILRHLAQRWLYWLQLIGLEAGTARNDGIATAKLV
ncbi:MAG: hypothetical protein M5U34_04230 [Chloroflexi bacterium]|nr:hypothetical protein [Chloroflexota bacterium]